MRALDKRYRRILATLFLAGLAIPLGVYAWGAFVIVRVPSLVEFNPDGTVRQVYFKHIPWTWVWNTDTLPKDVRAETLLSDGTRIPVAATYNSGTKPIYGRSYFVKLHRVWGSRFAMSEVLYVATHEVPISPSHRDSRQRRVPIQYRIGGECCKFLIMFSAGWHQHDGPCHRDARLCGLLGARVQQGAALNSRSPENLPTFPTSRNSRRRVARASIRAAYLSNTQIAGPIAVAPGRSRCHPAPPISPCASGVDRRDAGGPGGRCACPRSRPLAGTSQRPCRRLDLQARLQ